jgi:hypothetical protein
VDGFQDKDSKVKERGQKRKPFQIHWEQFKIFLFVNFWGILLVEIFSIYIIEEISNDIFWGIYRWNEAVNFFNVSVPSVNLSVIIFFYYQRIYRQTKNYRWKIHRRSISVSNFVGTLITDGIRVLHRQKNSVDKTVKCCSGITQLVRS